MAVIPRCKLTLPCTHSFFPSLINACRGRPPGRPAGKHPENLQRGVEGAAPYNVYPKNPHRVKSYPFCLSIKRYRRILSGIYDSLRREGYLPSVCRKTGNYGMILQGRPVAARKGSIFSAANQGNYLFLPEIHNLYKLPKRAASGRPYMETGEFVPYGHAEREGQKPSLPCIEKAFSQGRSLF